MDPKTVLDTSPSDAAPSLEVLLPGEASPLNPIATQCTVRSVESLDDARTESSSCSAIATPADIENSLRGATPVSPVSTASVGSEPSGASLTARPTAPPSGDGGAKSSALKALAGIGRVVSRSRQIDAEALQAIKAQRAKAKAEGTGGSIGAPQHQHSRTLSCDSVSDLAAHSVSLGHSVHNGPSNRPHHRRSHSGFHPSTAQAALPLTNPGAYADFLAGRTLAELQALQKAVEVEISRHLVATNTSVTKTNAVRRSSHGAVTPPLPSDAALSAHYATALAVAQQQKEQQEQAAMLQHALTALSRFGSQHSTGTQQHTQPSSPYAASEPGGSALGTSSPTIMFSSQPERSPAAQRILGGGASSLDAAHNSSLGCLTTMDPRASSPFGSSTPDFTFLNDFHPGFDTQTHNSQHQYQHHHQNHHSHSSPPLLLRGNSLSPLSPSPPSSANVFGRTTASLPPRPQTTTYKSSQQGRASDTSAPLPSLFAGLQLGGGSGAGGGGSYPAVQNGGSPLYGPNPWF